MTLKLPIIRPAKPEDLGKLVEFSQESGYGVTSLPRSSAVLEKRLYASTAAFQEKFILPTHETYQFCLEWEGNVIGTSCIVSRVGMTETFYAYHLLFEPHVCTYLNVDTRQPVLHFTRARKKPTEIGSLFLSKFFRHKDFGKLLSLCRFLFIATFRNRFAPMVIAELRGINRDGYAPFWEAIGRVFFQIDFVKADLLRMEHHACIEDLFPKHPLYLHMLPIEAQNVLGVTHGDTVPAQKMLEKQGFKMSHYFDLFDGGPHVYSPTDEIHAVRESREIVIDSLKPHLQQNKHAFICNTRLEFRATLAPLFIENGRAVLHPEVAAQLLVQPGDTIRYYFY